MVAVILVNYNGAADTIECIKSLSKIENADYELIVVDNCSTDDSVQLLNECRDRYHFTLLEVEENRGFASGNNIAIRYATEADYYLLLNNDTVVTPDFLEKLMEGFQHDENCGAVISKILYYSRPDMIWYGGGSLNFRTGRSEHDCFNKPDDASDVRLRKVTFASGCCLCISRQVIETVGLLNENFFLYEEDAEYCMRIIKAGFCIYYVPTSVIYHKVSASTGQDSSVNQYYTARNKYYLIREQYQGLCKASAYLYCTAQFLFRCLKRERSFRIYLSGVKAFLQGETGKRRGDTI